MPTTEEVNKIILACIAKLMVSEGYDVSYTDGKFSISASVGIHKLAEATDRAKALWILFTHS